ncbi:MAG TPA: glycosyltransferase, partial [Saprospiraceae bacterium]|nr:glycosyltransferase [Saprospiraceae bacterium]
MKPKITIITVTYNCEQVIKKTIDSVLSQTYGAIEYIIVDGASK